MSFPDVRPRRLRRTPALRRLVEETRVAPSELVLPLFLKEGLTQPRAISSLPGVVQHSRESLRKAAHEAVSAGVGGLMLFGVPESENKDETGSAGLDPDGILNLGIRDLVAEVGNDTVVMSDLCLDEFTSHGHCGVLAKDGSVDNDATLDIYAQMAVAQAKAGAHMVGPSGMMDGQIGVIRKAAAEAADLGLGGIMLFGVPETKDATGSGACAADGILNVAIADVVAEVGSALPVMADLCLDEFTDHGHCGVLAADGTVDNDATLEIYRQMAVVQAEAGADVVGPSGMMDGQVAAIRDALDAAGHADVAILAYSAKYASAFYGPFREAVDSSLQGDRRTYQQDGRNAREGVREALLDVAEGADLVMVKPALAYLDVLRQVRDAVEVPVAAYNISGEYAMVEAAAAHGWIDREPAILETLTSIRRAGADVILTYWATEVARLLSSR